VVAGELVERGQLIADLGNTGISRGPHVHFEVLLNDKVVNPIKYIKTERSKDNA
jgi:murein DD-endopeptidase MepM/ murein hydrolase activator NlpD